MNVALNRPTFVSGVYSSRIYGAYPSSNGNDGNKDPVAYQMDNSCVLTKHEVDPWWAVDLGAALAVVGVLFTNRADGNGNCLTHRVYRVCQL